MQIPTHVRYALLLVAAALLVTALAGPIRRTLDERERAAKSREIAERVAAERAAAAERFKANRESIVAGIRRHVERGEYIDALRAAAPFGAVPDNELRELYREAAQAESLRQRTEHYAKLVERDCNEANAREWASRMLDTVTEGGTKPAPPSRLVRVGASDARAIVLARMREPPPVEHAHARPGGGGAPAASVVPPPTPALDWIGRMRNEFRARLLPDYLGVIHSPKADSVICVWRAQGQRADGARSLAYTLDLWLAPAPDLKGLAGDAAAYAERPAGAG